jgi:hypothetical protein
LIFSSEEEKKTYRAGAEQRKEKEVSFLSSHVASSRFCQECRKGLGQL